jgi:hypothetical protein
MPKFIRAIGDEFKNRLGQKDTASVNRYEGFQDNGAIVLRDRRGTAKADFPDAEEKGFSAGDPMAIYKPTGAKQVSAAKAMGAFTGWTFAAVNAIASEVSNIQLRLYQVTGDEHEEKDEHPLLTLLLFDMPHRWFGGCRGGPYGAPVRAGRRGGSRLERDFRAAEVPLPEGNAHSRSFCPYGLVSSACPV